MKQPAAPFVIAHRGESFEAPENTHAAFDLAWRLGADAIELDIHLTRDGKVVVCHDADTFRTAAGRRRLVIRDCDAADLCQVDVGSWKGAAGAGQCVPLLADVLARVPSGKVVFVEMKAREPGLVAAAVAVMKASGLPPAAMPVISFHAQSIATFKRLWPAGPRAFYLSGFRQEESSGSWSPDVTQILETARQCGADGVSVQNKPPVDKDFIQACHAIGMACYVWTEDEPAAAKRFLDAGADGIVTNRAAWMRERFAAG